MILTWPEHSWGSSCPSHLWFHIAVGKALPMHGCEAVQNLPRDLPRVAFRDDRLSGDEAVQIPAGDVLHGNVERIVSCIPSQELDKIPRVLTWPGRVQTWDHMYLVHV